jgi:tetratricopeptide (TPR) repeat protein
MRGAAWARVENRLMDARHGYREAVRLCRQGNGQAVTDLVEALKGLGQIERDLGHGDVARALYEEAIVSCRKGGGSLTLAHTIRHLGDIHQDAGRLELAEPCYQEALTLYRSEKRTPPLDLANAIRPLAMLKESLGDAEEARRLWEEATDLYATVNVQEGVTECSARLAGLTR